MAARRGTAWLRLVATAFCAACAWQADDPVPASPTCDSAEEEQSCPVAESARALEAVEPPPSEVPGVPSGLYLLTWGDKVRQLVLPPSGTRYDEEMLKALDYFPGDPVVGCGDTLIGRQAITLAEADEHEGALLLWYSPDSSGLLSLMTCPTRGDFIARYRASYGFGGGGATDDHVYGTRVGDAPNCEVWTGAVAEVQRRRDEVGSDKRLHPN